MTYMPCRARDRPTHILFVSATKPIFPPAFERVNDKRTYGVQHDC